VSDEQNNPILEPVNLPQEATDNGAIEAAESAAEAEGMPIEIKPDANVQSPPSEPAPAFVEQALPSEPVSSEPAPVSDEQSIPSTEVPVSAETPVSADKASAEGRIAATAKKPAAEPQEVAPAPKPPVKPVEPKSDKMDWYILKVQSNREESIREGLLRRVAIAGLDRFFGDVIVPTEKVTEFKGGKKRVIKRKLYPGYLVVHMEINDETWFLVRETPGIGDFTGAAGRPSPMLPHEVQRIVSKAEEKSEKAPKLKIGFSEGERVKIKEGTFENFEGEVDSIDQTNGQVTIMINIFGRSTPVTLEYWQIEAL
jgi:transcription termination/antitermination protein NusG